MSKIEDMSPAERREGFYKAWTAHKASGFEISQAEADKIAAEWGIEAPKLQAPYRARVVSEARSGRSEIRGRGGY